MQKSEKTNKIESITRNREQQALEIQAFLTEYEKVQDQTLQFIGGMNQNFLLSLGSASVAIPILISNTTIPQNFIVLGLYLLAIIYAIIGMQYATSVFYVNTFANYVHKYLSPKLNQRLGTNTNTRVLQWEYYVRTQHRNPLSFFMATLGPAAASLLIVIPSLISMLAARYVQLLSVQQSLTGVFQEFAKSLIFPFSMVAWSLFVLSIISQFTNVIYALTTGYIASKKVLND